MTENKRFSVVMNEFDEVEYITDIVDCEDRDFADFIDFANEMAKENEQLKKEIENLKITIKARETLIDVCEKKFKELGYIITVDDDGYVIE